MKNSEKVYDMNRINTLLRYEKIPAYVMTAEQKAYLAGYRAQLESRKPVVVEEIDEVKVRKPIVDELEAIEEPTKEEKAVDEKVADLVKEVTNEEKKTRKKSTKKSKKNKKTEEAVEETEEKKEEE